MLYKPRRGVTRDKSTVKGYITGKKGNCASKKEKIINP